MEMLLRRTQDTTSNCEGFMDDVTEISESNSHIEKQLKRL